MYAALVLPSISAAQIEDDTGEHPGISADTLSIAERRAHLRHLPSARLLTLTRDEGLSSTNVYAITQDEQGFMWFGTENGLNRYDGYALLHFKRQRGTAGAPQSEALREQAAKKSHLG